MNIAVVGASGLIGSKVVELLRSEGHDVVASSRSSGVDVLTGAGLVDALAGADALVDVTNSPDFEADAVMSVFTTSATILVISNSWLRSRVRMRRIFMRGRGRRWVRA